MFSIIKILWGVAKRLLGKGGGKSKGSDEDQTVNSLSSAINPIKKMGSNLVEKLKNTFASKDSEEQLAEEHLQTSESPDTQGLFAYLKSKFTSLQTSLVDIAQNNPILEMLKDAKDKALSLANSTTLMILSAIGTVVGILGALGSWILTPIMPALDWVKGKLALLPGMFKKLGSFLTSALASLASILVQGMTFIPGLILKGLTHLPWGAGSFFEKPAELVDKLPDMVHDQITNLFSPATEVEKALPETDVKDITKPIVPFSKGGISEVSLNTSSSLAPKVDLKSAQLSSVKLKLTPLNEVDSRKGSDKSGVGAPQGLRANSPSVVNVHNKERVINNTHNYVRNSPTNKLRGKT